MGEEVARPPQEMMGVVPPEERMGQVPVTAVTPFEEVAIHPIPLVVLFHPRT